MHENEEDEYEYEGYAACTQYLGKSGITRKCVLGLAAILVSPFRPEKITMISLRQRGQNSDGVMFLALKRAKPYDWKYYRVESITITKQGKETFLEVDYWKFRLPSV